MRVSFRQGIVNNAITSTFIPGTGSAITLSVPSFSEPVSVHFAHGSANYLLTERSTIVDAWTGPFLSGTDYWLYWDISTASGLRTFGSTTLAPFLQANAPSAPAVGQHWFDTANKQMKVWNGVSWQIVVRVFAGKLASGSLPLLSISVNANLTISNPNYYLGTQAGLNTLADANDAGFLLFVNNSALKKSDGTFFTTEDTASVGLSSTTSVKFAATLAEGVAQEPLAAFSIAKLTDDNMLAPMTPFDSNEVVYGLIDRGVTTGEAVNLITSGIVENDTWTWSGANIPLYVDNTGTLTDIRPVSGPDAVAITTGTTTILILPVDIVPGLQDVEAEIALKADKVISPTINNFAALNASGNLIDAGVSASTYYTQTQVNNALALKLNLTGGTLTGDLTLNADPTAALHAATKQYVDAADATKQPLDADLTAIAALATTGAVVRTGSGTAATRTITGTASRVVVVDGDGVAGNPTIDVTETGIDHDTLLNFVGNEHINHSSVSIIAGTGLSGGGDITSSRTLSVNIGTDVQAWDADLDALAALATAGVIARTGAGTVSTRTITGTAGNVSVTNGDGVAGNPVLDLVDAGTPISAQFVKITTDAKGRTTATTPVLTADITTLVDGTYVNVSGDTMSGVLAMGNNKITGLAAATTNGDAVRFDEFDADVTNLATHIADATVHLTSDQNSWLDAVVPGAIPVATPTEVGYLSGVTSSVQTQLNAKYDEIVGVNGNFVAFATSGTTVADSGFSASSFQPLDADLTAVAGLSTTGLIARTGAGTAATRTITGTASRVTVANGDGVAGNPTLNVDESGIDHDLLLNFVGNEHIDHSTVTLTAGVGLTGGGDITASRTFNVAAFKGTLTTSFAGFTASAIGDTATDTITVTGAVVGDPVSLALPASPDAGWVFDAWVSGPNAVTLRATATTATSGPLTSKTYQAITFQYGEF